MSRLGVAIIILGGLTALVSGCGNRDPYYSAIPYQPIARRAYAILGPGVTVESRRRLNDFHQQLLREEWIAINAHDRALHPSRLRFRLLTRQGPRYTFELCLPLKVRRTWRQPRGCAGGLYMSGELHARRTADGAVRGLVHIPPTLSGSQLRFDIEPSNIGPILYLTFDQLERLPFRFAESEWDFQQKSTVLGRSDD